MISDPSEILPQPITGQLQDLLGQAISLDKADKGNIQFFDSQNGVLRILVQKGFREDFLEHFRIVRPFDSSACGRASGIDCPVMISDVMLDIGFAPHRDIAYLSGFRAVKSVPLHTKAKRFVGVLSTHFKAPQPVWAEHKTDAVADAIAELLGEHMPRLEAQ